MKENYYVIPTKGIEWELIARVQSANRVEVKGVVHDWEVAIANFILDHPNNFGIGEDVQFFIPNRIYLIFRVSQENVDILIGRNFSSTISK